MSAYKRVQQWATLSRVWHLFDCTWQDPYLSAVRICKYLDGKHKPIYSVSSKCGDAVVLINSRNIALRGDDWYRRAYFHATGYPGGATWTLAWELHDKDPTLIMKKAIYRQLAKNLERRTTMERLFIFPDENVPEEIMQNISNEIPQLRPVPRRLSEIPEEEAKSFPLVLDYPKDYVLK